MLQRIIVQIYNRMKYYAPQDIYKDCYKYSLVRNLRLKYTILSETRPKHKSINEERVTHKKK